MHKRKNISPSKAMEDFGKQKRQAPNSFNAEIEFYKRNPFLKPEVFRTLTPAAQKYALENKK